MDIIVINLEISEIIHKRHDLSKSILMNEYTKKYVC